MLKKFKLGIFTRAKWNNPPTVPVRWGCKCAYTPDQAHAPLYSNQTKIWIFLPYLHYIHEHLHLLQQTPQPPISAQDHTNPFKTINSLHKLHFLWDPLQLFYQTWQQRSTLISFTLSLLMWFMPNAKTEQTKTSPVSIPFNLSSSYLLCFCSYLFFLWSSVSVALFLLSSFAPRRLDYILHRIDANSFACLVIWNCLGELRIKK